MLQLRPHPFQALGETGADSDLVEPGPPTLACPCSGTLPSQALLGTSVPSLQADLCADPSSLQLEHLF